jgi:hypothetical protein
MTDWVSPFRIDVPQRDLDDLRRRLVLRRPPAAGCRLPRSCGAPAQVRQGGPTGTMTIAKDDVLRNLHAIPV